MAKYLLLKHYRGSPEPEGFAPSEHAFAKSGSARRAPAAAT